uniref:Uncharacterized protein n=1 Tax=Arundo donax TaxID=35708 RepID=A0A0A9H8Q7_ARUDO
MLDFQSVRKMYCNRTSWRSQCVCTIQNIKGN